MNKSMIFYEFFVNMNNADEIKKESIFQDSKLKHIHAHMRAHIHASVCAHVGNCEQIMNKL